MARWIAEAPEFSAEVTRLRDAALEEATNVLTAACSAAARSLAGLATGVTVPAHVWFGAARAVLDFAARFHREAELEQRLGAVEERLQRGVVS